MAKREYEYTGEDYPRAGLYKGDVRKLSVKRDPDGGVNARVWGTSDQKKLNLYYRTERMFENRWKEA